MKHRGQVLRFKNQSAGLCSCGYVTANTSNDTEARELLNEHIVNESRGKPDAKSTSRV